MIEVGTILNPCDACSGNDDNANVTAIKEGNFSLSLTLCQPCRGMLVSAVQTYDLPLSGDAERVKQVRIEEPPRSLATNRQEGQT